MNRAALNTVPLGSGNQNSWILAAISQGLALTGSLKLSVTKYARIAQTFALGHALHTTYRVYVAISSSFTLAGSVAFKSLKQIRSGPIEGSLRLDGVLDSHRIVQAALNQNLALSGSLTFGTKMISRETISHAFSLNGTLIGNDLSRMPAHKSRTVQVQNAARVTRVPASNSIGVA